MVGKIYGGKESECVIKSLETRKDLVGVENELTRENAEVMKKDRGKGFIGTRNP